QLHRVRGRRHLAAVRELWLARDEIAQERDVTPGRIIPDSAIIEAATAMPRERSLLLSLKGFHGRGAERYANRWVRAIRTAAELPEDELPQRNQRGDGPPVARAWAEKDPVAAQRLALAKDGMNALSEEHDVPTENLLTPDTMRRVLWSPPAVRDPAPLAAAVAEMLRDLGARQWQVELTGPV